MAASSSGQLMIVKYLVSRGSHINHKNKVSDN